MSKYIFLFLLISFKSNAQLSITGFPEDFQLIHRNELNIGEIQINGNYIHPQCDSVKIELYRDNILIYEEKQSKENFDFKIKLYAELVEYKLIFLSKNNNNWIELKNANKVLCGDVILLYGQSNMNAHSGVDFFNANFSDKFLRNYSYSLSEPDLLMWFPGKQPYAQIGSIGNHLYLNLSEFAKVPICIINAAEGGKNILQLSEENTSNRLDKNFFYGKLLSRLQYSGLKNYLRYMVFFQGEAEANTNEQNNLDYPSNFETLFNKLKQDFPKLEKFYEVQINVLTNDRIIESAGYLRDFQRRTKDLFPNQIEVYTAIGQYSFDGIHYGYESYTNIANGLSNLILRDFYAKTDNFQIEPPNIKYAYYTPTKDTVVLGFQKDQTFNFDPNTTQFNNSFFFTASLSDNIYYPLNQPVLSINKNKNEIYLKLNEPKNFEYLTYLPSTMIENNVFYGPSIKNIQNHAALSFFKFKIEDTAPIENNNIPNPLTFRLNSVNDLSTVLTWNSQALINLFVEIWRSFDGINFRKITNENISTEYFSDSGLLPEIQVHYKIRNCLQENCSNFSNILKTSTFKKRPYECSDKTLQENLNNENKNYHAIKIQSSQKIENAKVNYLFEKAILLLPGFEFKTNDENYFLSENRKCE